MLHSSTHRLRAVMFSLFACAIAFVGSPVIAQTKWHNDIDASMINDIVHRDGVLYMATFGGLLVYDIDRASFEQYANISGMPSNALRCLVFDTDNNLYIGTADFGIAKIRFSNGRPVLSRSLNSQIDGLSSNVMTSISLWGSDLLYGANPGAGTIRNDFASARYFTRDGLPSDEVRDVLGAGDHAWIATASGVAVLDRLGLIRRPTGGPPVSNVLASDGSRIWVGTNNGVWRFDPADSSWTDVGPATRIMHGLYWDGATMWGGSTRQLCRYTGTGSVWSQFNTAPVSSRYNFGGGGGLNQIRGLATGSDGQLYVSSVQTDDQRGANLIRFDGTTMFNLVPNAPGGNDIRRISIDTDGSVWTMFSGFYVGKRMPTGQWVNYNPSVDGAETPGNQFNNLALLADSQGFKWFCTLSRPLVTLDRLDDRTDAAYANDTWARYGIGAGGGDGLQSLSLQRGVEDPVGNRWFLGDISLLESQGWQGIQILARDGSEWFEMTPIKQPAMASGDIVDVAFGSFHAFVAHRTAGIQRWNLGGFQWGAIENMTGDTWSQTVPPTSLPGSVSAIELRSDGVIWIASDAGLFRYPSTRATAVVDEIPVYAGIGAGILSRGIADIVLDDDENLWVATNLGLNKIARDDETAIETYTTAVAYVTSLADLRYPISIITPLSNANCRSLATHATKDILYIGTSSGLTTLDYSAPPIVDTDVSQVYLYPNPVYKSRGQNELKIQNISGPVAVEVYTLEGVLVHTQQVDTNGQVAWDLTTATGFVVSSGNYLVRIIGPNGAITKTIAVLR